MTNRKEDKIGSDYKGVPILMDRTYENNKTREPVLLLLLYNHEPVVPPKKKRKNPWNMTKNFISNAI